MSHGSDEAIAAFLEIAGEELKELSLNNVKKVSRNSLIRAALNNVLARN